jgi:hypothetical protein
MRQGRVVNIANEIGSIITGTNLVGCKRACESKKDTGVRDTKECRSFVYCDAQKTCHIYEATLTGNEEVEPPNSSNNQKCTTGYFQCLSGINFLGSTENRTCLETSNITPNFVPNFNMTVN